MLESPAFSPFPYKDGRELSGADEEDPGLPE